MWWAGVGTASVVCDRREAVVVVHTLLPARLSERLSLGRHDTTRARASVGPPDEVLHKI